VKGGRCVCGCGQRAAHRHHVIYRQHVTRAGGDLRDPRNLVPVAFACHGAHHSGAARLPLARLPDDVYAFAVELLGTGLAYETLRRYYGGSDPRLNGLLD
jgi:hypothetical protein